MRLGRIRAAALVVSLAAVVAGVYFLVTDSGERRTSMKASEAPKFPAHSEAPASPVTPAPLRPAAKTAEAGIPTWTMIALLVMAAATCSAVLVSFYLYRWRRILLTNPRATVPEEWAEYLHQVGSHLKSLDANFRSGVGQLGRATTEHSTKIAALEESLGVLQHALSERDAEIRRLKAGYDAAVFRRFLTRFIRIDQSLKGIAAGDSSALDELPQLQRMFDDALDQCGVEAFAPALGTDYRAAKGVADNPRREKTFNHLDDFKIAEVLEPGYRLKSDEGEVLVQAKVKILVFGE